LPALSLIGILLKKNIHPVERKISGPSIKLGCLLVSVFAMALPVWSADPLVNLSVHDLNFAPQAQGTSSAVQVVVLTNSGGADLSITEIAITGENKADFAQMNNCPETPSVLPALAHCEIRVTFAPTITGTLVAALNISDNASGSPQTVNLKGVSTAPRPLATFGPASVAFGNQAMGTTSAAKLVILTNTGSATLNVNSEISINGPNSAEFHLQAVESVCPSGTWQLAPKTSCQIGVVFAPTSIGVKRAQISIADDAPGSPHSVELSGAGIAPPPANPK
jgi:hypothetical protein